MENPFSSFFGKDDNEEELEIPWLESPSIYDFLLNNFDAKTGRLTWAGFRLPDEERRFAKTNFRWAPGALEGALKPSGGINNDNIKADLVSNYLADIGNHNALKDKIALYNVLLEDDLLGYIDLAIREIVRLNLPYYSHIHDFILFLAKNAPDRGPVKFAIAILGVMKMENETDTIMLLGRHDEFTLYSAVALFNIFEEPESALWELAQAVEGWGRIQLVERLAPTTSPEIKEWLLLEGYRNNIMYQYLAYICATTGDLKSAISAEKVDDALLDAAGDIIQALINSGPSEGIDDYEDAAIVITNYLNHLQHRADKLIQLIIVDSILEYLMFELGEIMEEGLNGWDENIKLHAIQTAQSIIKQPNWKPLTLEGLKSDDKRTFYQAYRAAQILNIDTWEYILNRLQKEPLDTYCWQEIMFRANSKNINTILDLATEKLPLDQIATGAANELGFGPDYAVHRCLGSILQGLRRFPTLGWPLIAAALKSPVNRNRSMAIIVLSKWDYEKLNNEVRSSLEEALAVEPRDTVKERIKMVLKGQPLQ